MGAPVVHFEVLGKDPKKLMSFYSSLFGWEINSDNPMNYGLVRAGDKGIGGGIGPVPEGMHGHLTFYVEVDNLDEYLAKAEQNGGKTVVPVTVVPNMVTFALFQDPEGNLVGLVKSEN